jgi:4-hydroxybenzoate polyprenyltransferase
MTETPDKPSDRGTEPVIGADRAPDATPIPLEPETAPGAPPGADIADAPPHTPAPGAVEESENEPERAAGSGTDKASVLAKILLAAADIKIAHSVFALPFALLAAFLAGPGRHTRPAEGSSGETYGWVAFSGKLVLIVLCMVFARTWAMLVNRLADRRIDAKNPRTAKRAFADKRLSTLDGLLMLAGSGGLFVGACALFVLFYDNSWPLYGSLPVLAWIAFYSFTKRFTLLCHVFLGGALAVSPIAAAVAVDPGALALLTDSGPSIWLLSAMVLCWVAGFDVIYALQDAEFDTGEHLHSVPAKLGPERSIVLSRALHASCLVALLLAWWLNPNLGRIFGIGVGATAGLLIFEHLVLAKRGEAGLQKAFFTINGVISVVLGVLGIVDVFY